MTQAVTALENVVQRNYTYFIYHNTYAICNKLITFIDVYYLYAKVAVRFITY